MVPYNLWDSASYRKTGNRKTVSFCHLHPDIPDYQCSCSQDHLKVVKMNNGCCCCVKNFMYSQVNLCTWHYVHWFTLPWSFPKTNWVVLVLKANQVVLLFKLNQTVTVSQCWDITYWVSFQPFLSDDCSRG